MFKNITPKIQATSPKLQWIHKAFLYANLIGFNRQIPVSAYYYTRISYKLLPDRPLEFTVM